MTDKMSENETENEKEWNENEIENEIEHGRTCKWKWIKKIENLEKNTWENGVKSSVNNKSHHCMWMLDFENKMSIQIEWNKPFVYFVG
jgi:hypothetical protein